jgi:hypothetical protein
VIAGILPKYWEGARIEHVFRFLVEKIIERHELHIVSRHELHIVSMYSPKLSRRPEK